MALPKIIDYIGMDKLSEIMKCEDILKMNSIQKTTDDIFENKRKNH